MNFFFWIKLWSEERRDDADSFREIIHHHKKYIQKHKKGKWDRQWHNSILHVYYLPFFFFFSYNFKNLFYNTSKYDVIN